MVSGQCRCSVILSEAVPKSKNPYSALIAALPKGILPTIPAGNLFALLFVLILEDVMRAYLANLTTKARILLAVPLIAIAYVIVTMVVPAVVHAAVPEVVRSVLSLI